MSKSKAEELNEILRNLRSSSSDIEACAVVSEDGLMIASLLPQGLEEERIAAMSAVMMSMGTRTAQELQRGSLEQLFVKGDKGYIIGVYAGPHALLLALAKEDAKLGLIFFDLSKAAEETRKIFA